MFYQSDCELVTFDTVELFFLRKENISIYIMSKVGIHLIVSVTVILNSKVVSIKMFSKCDISLIRNDHWLNCVSNIARGTFYWHVKNTIQGLG